MHFSAEYFYTHLWTFKFRVEESILCSHKIERRDLKMKQDPSLKGNAEEDVIMASMKPIEKDLGRKAPTKELNSEDSDLR